MPKLCFRSIESVSTRRRAALYTGLRFHGDKPEWTENTTQQNDQMTTGHIVELCQRSRPSIWLTAQQHIPPPAARQPIVRPAMLLRRRFCAVVVAVIFLFLSLASQTIHRKFFLPPPSAPSTGRARPTWQETGEVPTSPPSLSSSSLLVVVVALTAAGVVVYMVVQVLFAPELQHRNAPTANRIFI